MERTDEEIVNDIQKAISDINRLLLEASASEIECEITQTSYLNMGGSFPHTFVNFKPHKRLTPNYVAGTGGY